MTPLSRADAEALYGVDRVTRVIEANDGIYDDNVLYCLEQGMDIAWFEDEMDDEDLNAGRESWS